ncbi:RCC1 repeat- and reductase domain-containing protein, partial [Archangium violaceum Cb vi76]
MQGLSGVVAVAAGYGHSLAVRSDGTVWSWGYNSEGQLGDGTTNNRTTPVQVSGLSGVVSVAAGRFHALAVRSDGSVWAWG